jgi:hypothetical protein
VPVSRLVRCQQAVDQERDVALPNVFMFTAVSSCCRPSAFQICAGVERLQHLPDAHMIKVEPFREAVDDQRRPVRGDSA